ncbi:multidrug resistance protein B [Carnobacterium sp. 17-4]|uniref:DHA2 family efflux MFS transporter permease subunit n=1 Tax=Carnobacterium sp. (strain 17-4) TaxID=208596 RepID=UPI0002059199|nr:DHA2 family efflux MFS transporter permease subunit [Carnobacterium sp. 17-4]AEB30933.1 multidrug resistance protein B [Carnobacterium sp. 17-4]
MKEKKYLITVVVMMVAAFISALNNVLLNNALPSIMDEFQIASFATTQWLTTSYMLTAGVLIPASAFFITRFKSRNVFLTALMLFNIGTILAYFSTSFSFLLVSRIIQACGASVLSPLLMNIMITVFDREDRGKAMGMYGFIIMFAPSIGPTISGVLIDFFNWRALFLMILPFSLICLIVGFFKVDSLLPVDIHKKMDYLSVVLSGAGLSAILLGVNQFSNANSNLLISIGIIVVGLILVGLFIKRQFSIGNPLLDLSIYKFPMYALSSILLALLAMLMYSTMVTIPYFLQKVQLQSVSISGLVMLPPSVASVIAMPICGRWFDKYGIKPMAYSGFSIILITTLALSQLTMTTSLLWIVLVLIVRNVGTAMIMMPIQAYGLNQLPDKLNPSGTATNSTIQQVFGAVGTSVVTIAMTSISSRQEISLQGQGQLAEKALLVAIDYSQYIFVGIAIVALVIAYFLKSKSMYKAPVLEV